jgi:hypothetical protein
MQSFDTYAGVFGVLSSAGELIMKAKQSKMNFPSLNFDILDWSDKDVIAWIRYGSNIYIGTDARIGAMSGFLWSMSGYPKLDLTA